MWKKEEENVNVLQVAEQYKNMYTVWLHIMSQEKKLPI